MQQFVVPQFIDVEDKVIGPITVRQFLIILVGGGLIFVAYKLSDFTLFILWFVILAGLTFALAFLRVNGRPVHYFLLNFIQTSKLPKLRIWYKVFDRRDFKTDKNKKIEVSLVAPTRNRVRTSRLAELSLIVDTGGVYQGEDGLNSNFDNL